MNDDLISRHAALYAIDTWPKYGFDPDNGLVQLDNYDTLHVPYVRYEDIVHALKHLPSAQPLVKCVAKVTMTDEQVREAFENAKLDFIAAAQPTQLEIDMAYMRGKVDGIRQCTEKLRKLRESINV